MNNICVSCLSHDRNLFPIGEFWNVFDTLLQSEHAKRNKSALKVCWECEAHLRNIQNFQQRTLKCIKILEHYQSLPSFQCQSTLSKCKLNILEYTNEVQEDLKHVNISDIIKTEYVDIPLEPEFNSVSNEIAPLAIVKLQEELSQVKEESSEGVEEENNINDLLTESPLKVFIADEDDRDFGNESTDTASSVGDSAKKKLKKGKVLKEENPKAIIIVKEEPKPISSRLWTCELVSEDVMLKWRQEDENEERYKRLHMKCKSCLVAFNYEDQLKLHNMKHHHESLGPHVCDICQTRSPTEDALKEHRLRHMQTYRCKLCQFSSRDLHGVTRHLIVEHAEATWQCTQCDQLFKTWAQLRYHRDKHGMQQYKCRFCEKAFRVKNTMYTHMLIAHKNLPREKCPICGKFTKNKYSLKHHMKTHSEPKDTVYYCELCKMQYKTAQSYKQHVSTSMKHLKPEELKFECEECGRRFVTEKRRQSHHKSVHLKKGQFPCNQCAKSYATRRALKMHVAQKHENSYVGPPRDKTCHVCGKGFTATNILKNHMRTHTGERPYHCRLCEATFSHSAALYTHNKLVHEKVKRNTKKRKMAD